MILADANIWIDFFRCGKPGMRELLDRNQIIMHPHLVAELALGSLCDRASTLAKLDNLPQARVVLLQDVRRMIEARILYSKGVCLTDAHLVASCLASPGIMLWTSDARLGKIADMLGIRANLPC